MDIEIESSWKTLLKEEFEKPYFTKLMAEVKADYLLKDPPVYPPEEDLFKAFNFCPFSTVRVVLLGQDPYHRKGKAHGLAFSVPGGITIPPSLRNIYKELHADLGTPIPQSGNLAHWAQQGVLLLNSTMTVQEGKAGSHQGKGWETFTDTVIQKVSDQKEHVVFLLWGNFAQSKRNLIDEDKHLVLEAAHPSPLSARNGFFGSKHFSKTNEYLEGHGQEPIYW